MSQQRPQKARIGKKWQNKPSPRPPTAATKLPEKADFEFECPPVHSPFVVPAVPCPRAGVRFDLKVRFGSLTNAADGKKRVLAFLETNPANAWVVGRLRAPGPEPKRNSNTKRTTYIAYDPHLGPVYHYYGEDGRRVHWFTFATPEDIAPTDRMRKDADRRARASNYAVAPSTPSATPPDSPNSELDSSDSAMDVDSAPEPWPASPNAPPPPQASHSSWPPSSLASPSFHPVESPPPGSQFKRDHAQFLESHPALDGELGLPSVKRRKVAEDPGPNFAVQVQPQAPPGVVPPGHLPPESDGGGQEPSVGPVPSPANHPADPFDPASFLEPDYR